MDDQSPTRPRTLRSYARVTLRVFMLVILAIATLLGWAAHRARTQREAIRAIRTLGGHFSFDPSYRQRPGPTWKTWLADRIGADYVYRVEYVTSLDNMTDANLVELEALARLKRVDLSGSGITNLGLDHLKGLSELSQLSLADTAIDGAGLSRLKGLSALTELDLAGTWITSAGMENLRGLTSPRNVGPHSDLDPRRWIETHRSPESPQGYPAGGYGVPQFGFGTSEGSDES